MLPRVLCVYWGFHSWWCSQQQGGLHGSFGNFPKEDALDSRLPPPASRHARSGDRTHDLSVARPTLSPVELAGDPMCVCVCVCVCVCIWGGGVAPYYRGRPVWVYGLPALKKEGVARIWTSVHDGGWKEGSSARSPRLGQSLSGCVSVCVHLFMELRPWA